MSGNEIAGWVLAYILSFTLMGAFIYAIKEVYGGGKKK